MPAVRFLLADDHDVLRRGVRATLEENPNWKVVAEARDGKEAVEKARQFEPDVAILDFSMPCLDGLGAAREIVRNRPDTRVLILTVHDSDALVQEMRKAGAHGYLRKVNAERDLAAALQALVSKADFFPSNRTTSVHRPRKAGNGKPGLTARQKEIVKLLAQGLRSETISKMLGISPKTVETHRQNVLVRTNSRSTAELVRYAIRNGIINP